MYLTTQQVCELLGCSVPTLNKWQKENGLPFIQIGAFTRFEELAVRNWFEGFVKKNNPVSAEKEVK